MSRSRFKFNELKKSIVLIVKTKSPEKWLLIDRETGQSYQGNNNGHWDRLEPIIKKRNDVKHNG